MVYSANGKMVGIFDWRPGYDVNTLVCNIHMFDIAPGVYMHSHSFNACRPLSNNIWAHGESLRFATADAATITIWEVGFTLGATPMAVETLPAPDGLDSDLTAVQLSPITCRLAHLIGGEVLIWDTRNSEYLLHCTDTKFSPGMTFSSDGCFFACPTTGSEIYIWKESPAGYILHRILALSARCSGTLLSQNGESLVAFGGRTVQLWRTGSHTTPPSSNLTQAPHHTENFVLGFSPDETLAAVAVPGERRVTVLNLKFGVPQLTIDAGMEVHDLRVTESSVDVVGHSEVATWCLPAGDCATDARVGLEDRTKTIPLIVNIHRKRRETLYVVDTRKTLTKTVWRDGKIPVREMVPYPENPSDWGQPCDYQVADDWWILGPHKKRLLMLPPPWQSTADKHRVWQGRFLALVHSGLSEPVILELDP